MTEYEKMGGTYHQAGDYLLPNLKNGEGQNTSIGIWGDRHRRFLKTQHRVLYYNLLTTGKLNSYLSAIDKQAKDLYDTLVKSLAEKEDITEDLKANSPMIWIQKMNNIRNCATEIVNAKVIFI